MSLLKVRYVRLVGHSSPECVTLYFVCDGSIVSALHLRIGEPTGEASRPQSSLASSSSETAAAAATAPPPALRAQAHEEPTHAVSVAHSERPDMSASQSSASSASTGAMSSSSAAIRTNKSHAAREPLARGHELLASNCAERPGEERRGLTQRPLPVAATTASAAAKSSAAAAKNKSATAASASASGVRVENAEQVAVDAGDRESDNDRNNDQPQRQTRAAASVETGRAIAIAAVPRSHTRPLAAAAANGEAAATHSGRHESPSTIASQTCDPRTIITTPRYLFRSFNSFDRAIIRIQLDQCLSRIVEQNRSLPRNDAYKNAMELFRRFKQIEGKLTIAIINTTRTQDNAIWDLDGIKVLIAGWPREAGCLFGYCRNYEFDITGAYLQKAIPQGARADMEFFFLLDVEHVHLILSFSFITIICNADNYSTDMQK